MNCDSLTPSRLLFPCYPGVGASRNRYACAALWRPPPLLVCNSLSDVSSFIPLPSLHPDGVATAYAIDVEVAGEGFTVLPHFEAEETLVTFSITTPSAVVEATIVDGFGINFVISVSVTEKGATDGLLGVWDGDQSNDFLVGRARWMPVVKSGRGWGGVVCVVDNGLGDSVFAK